MEWIPCKYDIFTRREQKSSSHPCVLINTPSVVDIVRMNQMSNAIMHGSPSGFLTRTWFDKQVWLNFLMYKIKMCLISFDGYKWKIYLEESELHSHICSVFLFICIWNYFQTSDNVWNDVWEFVEFRIEYEQVQQIVLLIMLTLLHKINTVDIQKAILCSNISHIPWTIQLLLYFNTM